MRHATRYAIGHTSRHAAGHVVGHRVVQVMVLRLRFLFLDSAKLVLVHFELFIAIATNFAIRTGLMGTAMPALWVSASLLYK